MRSVTAIDRANRAGRMGLVVYTIPNFPNPSEYKRISALLLSDPSVTVIETTIPVDRGFSPHANSTIKRSHQVASQYSVNLTQFVKTVSSKKPHICVFYKHSHDSIGFNEFVRTTSSKLDGILLEWNERNEKPYEAISKKNGVEFIKCVGPWMSKRKIQALLSRTSDSPLVYLMSAEATGGKLFSAKALETTALLIKQYRPNAKVAAGFGIRGQKEIRQLATIRGIDAVIIGTEFLKQSRQGSRRVTKFLKSLEGALCRVN